MPVHDWTRASAGRFHAWHTIWLTHLTEALSARLPAGYYSLPEQKIEVYKPDVTTFAAFATEGRPGAGPATAVAVAEPRAERRIALRAPAVAPGRRLVIRAVAGERVVAVLELVSTRNKSRVDGVADFAGKVAEFVRAGVHALVVDILPPGPLDPGGPHPEVCARLDPDGPPDAPPPAGRPFTFASYRAGADPVGFLKYAGVGEALPDAPLFLDDGAFVDVPLEETYMTGYARLPAPIRAALEGDATS